MTDNNLSPASSDGGFKIMIVGLGLIGGSMAYALRGFKNAEIIGVDIDPETRRKAVKEKAVHRACADMSDAAYEADLIIMCTYPDLAVKLLEEHRDELKRGVVVTDVCGVKTDVSRRIRRALPDHADYVGGHPMAGKEVEGFDNASPELFWMTGYIITPFADSKPESVKLIKELAHFIGATRITVASPEEHDAIIAYTSDLMHVSASALCLTYPEKMNRAYTAGSFRDCTRVARINPELWTELFLSNAKNTAAEIDRLIENLNTIKSAILSNDEKGLYSILERVHDNKLTMQAKEPESI